MSAQLLGFLMAVVVVALVFRFGKIQEVKPGPIRRTKSGAPMSYR